ncbi:NEFA-interacting nuclear protein Nip30 [Aspergillus heteromorphus CBS 117.55]|uniref:NEFA-interacting nuclear protein Nip30 n=1 Tax=Aspergillus heteromorphus CBS 117.55 TaxID=1448321 RepID=A0A317W752_9EURO|nr:NEFA-interacting nuclear protein Nip30 [Aspergillus heteromorphus CBS 117.55]PWY81899.1 NEFA-interacting nuclear protein Nip30 [Aspergillus heteromorphus CBS 117.55]
MSSGFVSAGTDQQPVERDDEWVRVQHELEEERRRKAELGKQEDGKSLYDVLQQNKMAKQEAFEEKIKLKNQFRSLDEDEVDFLDSIMESTRAKEAAVKKETAEQLEVFRRQREEAEKVLLEDTSADVAPVAEGEDWKIPARKRRREKTKDLLIPGKKRKSLGGDAAGSPTDEQKPDAESGKTGNNVQQDKSRSVVKKPEALKASVISPATSGPVKETKPQSQPAPKPAAKPSLSLGLGDYGSDSE